MIFEINQVSKKEKKKMFCERASFSIMNRHQKHLLIDQKSKCFPLKLNMSLKQEN